MRSTGSSSCRRQLGRWSQLVAVAALCSATSTVLAGGEEHSKRFTAISEQIGRLENHEKAAALRSEIEQIRTWLSEAQALHAAEKHDKAQQIVLRIEALAEFAAARQQRLSTEDAAAQAEVKAKAAQKAAAQARRAAAAAHKQRKTLENKGL